MTETETEWLYHIIPVGFGEDDHLAHDLHLVRPGASVSHAVRSLSEIASIRQTGRLLVQGLDAFGRMARPGRLLTEVAAEVDGVLRAGGCTDGALMTALGSRPALAPPASSHPIAVDDILQVSLSYTGPKGYGFEVSRIYSYTPLDTEEDALLRAFELAYHEALLHITPGNGPTDVADALVRTLQQAGLSVSGRMRPDVVLPPGSGTAGASELETAQWRFASNMVVVFHPGLVTTGERGFHLAETVLVRPDGAVPLSPRGAVYARLSADREGEPSRP